MKMTKKFDQLDDAFNVATEVVTESLPAKIEKKKPDRLTKDDIEKDYEYTRGNLLRRVKCPEHTKLLDN